MKQALLTVGFLIGTTVAFALPSPLHVKPNAVTNPLRSNAVANGGQAQDEFSLLGVETHELAGGHERLILNYGDRFGKPLKGEPGFFQVALDRDGRRIVIDLSQVARTGVDPTQLRAALIRSKFVASSEMTMDPQDQSTNLTLLLKSPVELRISTDAGARSRIVLDLAGAAK